MEFVNKLFFKAIEEINSVKKYKESDEFDETDVWGMRFGDPHALHIAGFLAFSLGLDKVLVLTETKKVRLSARSALLFFAFALRSLCARLCSRSALEMLSLCSRFVLALRSLCFCAALALH